MTKNISIYEKYTSSADRDDIIAGRSSVALAFRGCSFSLYIGLGDGYLVNFFSQYFSNAISSFK